MKIEAGLLDHMVLQRNRKNESEASFSGIGGTPGPIMAAVRQGGRVVKGFAAVKVGIVARGKASGCLKGLPVGGPYDIELKAGDETLVVRDVLVGDVWLLGGQSNMQGCGLFPKQRLPVDPQVRAFTMDDRWSPAKDPIHNLWACVDPVHVDLGGGVRSTKPDPDWGVCPGPAFGVEMRRLTGVPQGLIACAHGGTSMTQWDPKRKKEGGKSLYGAMIRRLNKNGRRVAGLIWYQGCSDADAASAALYTKRMKAFVAALRRDSGDGTLPVVIVQIARVISADTAVRTPWNSIQDQQRQLPLVVKHFATVPAIDLALDDGIHIGGQGQYVLGSRLARAMQVLRGDRKIEPPPIALKSVSIETARGLGVAVVEFSNVVGKLRSGDRPSGFTIASVDSTANHYDIELDGPRARVRTGLPPSTLSDAVLHYGYGTDPYCNIRDEAGRSLPVFGPVRMGTPRALSPYIRNLRVSGVHPLEGEIGAVECPVSLDALGLSPRAFPDAFCNVRKEIEQSGARAGVVYFACRMACKEAMKLALVLGYDGPVKAWMDGTLVFRDLHGVNPATVDKGAGRFTAAAGEHEIVVALSTNRGLAWGVFLKFERLDVSRSQRLKGPAGYAMPELLG